MKSAPLAILLFAVAPASFAAVQYDTIRQNAGVVVASINNGELCVSLRDIQPAGVVSAGYCAMDRKGNAVCAARADLTGIELRRPLAHENISTRRPSDLSAWLLACGGALSTAVIVRRRRPSEAA